jgi:hypothetical protein
MRGLRHERRSRQPILPRLRRAPAAASPIAARAIRVANQLHAAPPGRAHPRRSQRARGRAQAAHRQVHEDRQAVLGVAQEHAGGVLGERHLDEPDSLAFGLPPDSELGACRRLEPAVLRRLALSSPPRPVRTQFRRPSPDPSPGPRNAFSAMSEMIVTFDNDAHEAPVVRIHPWIYPSAKDAPNPEHRMPQHPARHDAPAHQVHALADPQIEGEIAGNAHRLADLHVSAGPRMRVAEAEHHGLAPIAPPDALRGSARHDQGPPTRPASGRRGARPTREGESAPGRGG